MTHGDSINNKRNKHVESTSIDRETWYFNHTYLTIFNQQKWCDVDKMQFE